MVALLFIISGHVGPRALLLAGRTRAATLRAHPTSLGVPQFPSPRCEPLRVAGRRAAGATRAAGLAPAVRAPRLPWPALSHYLAGPVEPLPDPSAT
jgi:hypothetical protein